MTGAYAESYPEPDNQTTPQVDNDNSGEVLSILDYHHSAETLFDPVDAETSELEEIELQELKDATMGDSLKMYVRDVPDDLLSAAQERELARRKDQGDEAAKRELVEKNLRLVMSITRNYTNAEVPLL